MTVATEKKWKCPAKAKALLTKVKEAIMEEPKRLEMADWAGRRKTTHGPVCGTTACIAGWAFILGTSQAELKRRAAGFVKATQPITEDLDWADLMLSYDVDVPSEAGELMGLPVEPNDVDDYHHVPGYAYRLYYTGDWPQQFRMDFANAQGNKKREAKVTCARIDHFIETGF